MDQSPQKLIQMSTDPLSDEACDEWYEEYVAKHGCPPTKLATWQEATRRAEKWLQELDDDNEKLAIDNHHLRELLKGLMDELEREGHGEPAPEPDCWICLAMKKVYADRTARENNP